MKRIPLACALAIGALAIPAARAAVIVRAVDSSGYPRIRMTVVTSSPTDAPSLQEDGQPAAGLRATNLGRVKSVVLLLDRSRSMAGRSLDDAVAAARSFVASKQPADRIAIVAFGSHALELTGFSSATIDADTALRTISVDSHQGTALYDAIALGARALGSEGDGGRVILVVTDGRDVSSQTSLEDAVAAARAAGANVYTVGIEGSQFTPDALRAIARRTGGIYRGAASTAALSQIYAAIAQELRRTWRLEYLTAGRPGDRVALEVAAPGEGSAKKDLALSGTGGSPGPSSILPSAAYGPEGTLALALAIGLIVLLAAGFVLASVRASRLQGRLAPHVGEAKSREKRKRGRQRFAALAGLFRATERTFAHTRQWRTVNRLLERADLPLRTVEFVYVAGAASFGLGLLTAVSGARSVVILLAFAVGALAPLGFVWFKAQRRRNAFEAQLPDLLISLAASLKAGHSFKQGIQAVVDEGLEPAGKELKRVLTETRLGRPMEDALAEMAERIGSKNLAFIVTAVNIQNQVGGSLAGLFDMVADTVRQRQQFARKIKALTAMGRMSAYTLIGLPFFVAGALTLLNPSYMDPLYHASTGHKLMFMALGMMAFGSLILKKIVSFRG